ncbi:unnamed protein product [Amoebophrya sp. A25]|nr:unnamed protein product [Amoebophrya sp. A25]|eukprot:GSA25T00000973001.1
MPLIAFAVADFFADINIIFDSTILVILSRVRPTLFPSFLILYLSVQVTPNLLSSYFYYPNFHAFDCSTTNHSHRVRVFQHKQHQTGEKNENVLSLYSSQSCMRILFISCK